MDLPPPELTPGLTEAVDDESRVRQELEKRPHWAVPVLELLDPSQPTEIPVRAVEEKIPGCRKQGGRATDDDTPHAEPTPIAPAGTENDSNRDDRCHRYRRTLGQEGQTQRDPECGAKSQWELVPDASDDAPQNERCHGNGDDIVVDHRRLIGDLRLKRDERGHGHCQKRISWEE